MRAIYQFRVGDGETVEMIGPAEKLDKISHHMQTHALLLKSSKNLRQLIIDMTDGVTKVTQAEIGARLDEANDVIKRATQ